MKILMLSFAMILNFSNLFAGNTEYKVYVDNKNNIRIKYPSSWAKLNDTRTTFLIIRPIEKSGQVFRENINLIISDNQGLDIDKYNKAARHQLQKRLIGYKEEKVGTVLLDGKLFHQVNYEHQLGNLNLKVLYYFFVRKNKVYQFTCSTTKENYTTFMPIFEFMMKSLKI